MIPAVLYGFNFLYQQGLIYHYLASHRLAEKTLRDAARIDPASHQTWWVASLEVGMFMSNIVSGLHQAIEYSYQMWWVHFTEYSYKTWLSAIHRG